MSAVLEAQLAVMARAQAQGLARAGVIAPMTITLVPVTVPPGRGGYGGRVPPRMRWLHPGAAAAYARIAGDVVVTDLYRSADSSLSAMAKKRGVLPPGYSRHGYGLAIDLDTTATMRIQDRTKKALDDWMAAHGWTCHRLDGRLDSEAWHYNWLDGGAPTRSEPSSRAAGERQLASLYGDAWVLTPRQEQAALARLRLYGGAIDGKIGPLSLAARDVFSRAWRCTSARYQRVLAFVAAELRTPEGRAIDVKSGTVAT